MPFDQFGNQILRICSGRMNSGEWTGFTGSGDVVLLFWSRTGSLQYLNPSRVTVWGKKHIPVDIGFTWSRNKNSRI